MLGAEISTPELVKLFDTSSVKDVYPEPIEIDDDVGSVLGIGPGEGRIIAIRADDTPTKSAKWFIGRRLVERVKPTMDAHPDYSVFDGAGPSSLPVIRHFAHEKGWPSSVLVARESPIYLMPASIAKWRGLKIIRAKGQAEKGYVNGMARILADPDYYKVAPLHQAFYGPHDIAPVGNYVAQWCVDHDVWPDATVWCLASGASVYGIGRVIARHFPRAETTVVTKGMTIADATLRDPARVRTMAIEALRWYRTPTEDLEIGWLDTMAFPLHLRGPSIAGLRYWIEKGAEGIDHVIATNEAQVRAVDIRLRAAGYVWSTTTCMCLVEAIKLAKQGKTVIVMVYGPGLRYYPGSKRIIRPAN